MTPAQTLAAAAAPVNSFLPDDVLLAILLDSGMHWFDVWRLRAVCRSFWRVATSVLPLAMIRNCVPGDFEEFCEHKRRRLAPPLLHFRSSDDQSGVVHVFLKPVKWDPEAETLLFRPTVLDPEKRDPNCVECLALKETDKRRHGTAHLFAPKPGWSKAGHSKWESLDEATYWLRKAWNVARYQEEEVSATKQSCIHRETEGDVHPAFRMVYSVLDVDEYLTTGGEECEESVNSSDTEFYFTVNYRVLEALVSFPWVLHGFVSSYVAPPTFLPRRLRNMAMLCDRINDQQLLPAHKDKPFFGDLYVDDGRKTFKRINCSARTTDLILAGRSDPFRKLKSVLQTGTISDLNAEEQVSDYLSRRYLQPK
ncbi:hypothetical protein HDU87_007317 [Geranomyces variabilis]|uniref:F-box domain-containing protein n=1 Tax=Geranomyces variabilis TaxID=109894 RepID=A0AAD5TE48_9FUNG|nr:hypothetical protein HDU87_007317 [Geranomyces variabilis]